MYLEDIDFHRPTNLQELLDLLKTYGEKARILAGGTDLILQMKLKSKKPQCLIDIKGIPGFKQMQYENDQFVVGCNTTLTELWKSPDVKKDFPALWHSINGHADRQIRNRGTLIGNLCNASPAADTTPPLITYGTKVLVQSSSGQRTIALEDFFAGPGKTVMNVDELATKVFIPRPGKNSYSSFQKLGRVYDDIALLNAAAQADFDETGKCISAIIAMGAVGPTTRRAPKAEKMLENQPLNENLIVQAARQAMSEASPISDVRASEEYRRTTIGVLVERALLDIKDQQIQSKVGV